MYCVEISTVDPAGGADNAWPWAHEQIDVTAPDWATAGIYVLTEAILEASAGGVLEAGDTLWANVSSAEDGEECGVVTGCVPEAGELEQLRDLMADSEASAWADLLEDRPIVAWRRRGLDSESGGYE